MPEETNNNRKVFETRLYINKSHRQAAAFGGGAGKKVYPTSDNVSSVPQWFTCSSNHAKLMFC